MSLTVFKPSETLNMKMIRGLWFWYGNIIIYYDSNTAACSMTTHQLPTPLSLVCGPTHPMWRSNIQPLLYHKEVKYLLLCKVRSISDLNPHWEGACTYIWHDFFFVAFWYSWEIKNVLFLFLDWSRMYLFLLLFWLPNWKTGYFAALQCWATPVDSEHLHFQQL